MPENNDHQLPTEQVELDEQVKARLRQAASRVEERAVQLEESEERPDMTTEEAMSRADRKALIAQLLDRGLVNARLEVRDAEPGFYYMWARDHDPDIERLLALGFEIVPETREEHGLHGTGDNRRRIGDVILMRTSEENHKIIEEVKTEIKAKKAASGKRDYLRRAKAHGVPVLDPLGVGREMEE